MSMEIEAIRVRDIDRQQWFNYNNGGWDRVPQIPVGGNIYIAFSAINKAGALGISGKLCTLRLEKDGQTVANRVQNQEVNGRVGIEWTGKNDGVGKFACKASVDVGILSTTNSKEFEVTAPTDYYTPNPTPTPTPTPTDTTPTGTPNPTSTGDMLAPLKLSYFGLPIYAWLIIAIIVAALLFYLFKSGAGAKIIAVAK